MTIDWLELHRIRLEINEAERTLERLYARRLALIWIMVDNGMGQREIGAYWGISNPRISNILKNSNRDDDP